MFLLIFCCVLTAWLQEVGTECPPILSRKEWDGEKPKYKIPYLITPLDLVIIQHTVTQTCSNDQTCLKLVKDIQKTHMNETFLWDIGPSFLIASTGKIYEGRGWHHIAIHTYGYNNQSIGIAFIGTFNNQEPSIKALDAAKALIQCGVDDEHLTADYHVVVHSQLLPTESPGQKLASKIRSWPKWKQDATEIKKRAAIEDNVELQITKDDPLESRAAGNSASDEVSLSRPKRQILTTPKEIDMLTNARNVIAELIDNIRNLAQQTLKTAEALTRGLNRQVALFIERLTSGLSRHKDEINGAVNVISVLPVVNKCTKPIQNRANTLFDNSETKAKDCASLRTKNIDNMIKNLGELSSNAINFSNTAVDETRNCTELNFGIESLTRTCLTSVTRNVNTATKTYESQKNLAINTITTALDDLPAALDQCAKSSLAEAATDTTNVLREVKNCKPSLINPFRW